MQMATAQRKVNNSGAAILSGSRPGFFRRAVTHVFDRGIYVTLGALLAIMSGDTGRFWMRQNTDDIALALALASLAVFVMDQLLFMAVYGVTFSKWVMGYRLRTKDGRPPGIIRAFFWSVVVEPVEVITLGIVSLILTWKREDRATFHDLVLGTRAVRVKNKQRGIRLLASAALVILMFSAAANIVSYAIYSTFVVPVRNQIRQDGQVLIPRPGTLEGREYGRPVVFKDLILFDAAGTDVVDICYRGKSERFGHDRYIVMVGAKKLFASYTGYEDFTDSVHPNLHYFGMLSSVYPFKESPVDVARHVLMDSEPDFSLLSPARNLTRAYGYILWGIMAEDDAVEVFEGPDFLILTAAHPSGRMVSIWMIRADGMDLYHVVDGEAEESVEAWQAYLGKVLAEFSPLPPDAERIEKFRQCPPDEDPKGTTLG